MKHLYIILITTLLLSACADDRRVVALLDRAETLMDSLPDSAHTLLMEADSLIPRQSEQTRMRHAVLMAEANNKLYLPLPSDTIFQEVVDYYDHHGTPNQQLKAHYLLGCIYRDRGEVPMALQCYEDAVEKADTLSADCDYNTLFRIYGQMAELFRAQYLPEEELKALRKYSYYASKANDMFSYIKGIELMVVPYFAMRDTIQVFHYTTQSAQLYKKYGYPQEAANVYHEMIDIYIGTSQYEKAKELMHICETESGLFDSIGTPTNKHYYYLRGLYYEGVNCPDSAEISYRHLLEAGYKYDAYKGLLSIFTTKKNTDSIVKYSFLCEEGLETILSENQMEATIKFSSMYNYTRHQKIAEAKKKEAENERRAKWEICIISLLLIGFVTSNYIKYRKKKNAQIRQIGIDYTNAVVKFSQAKEELLVLQDSYNDLKENVLVIKQQEIEQLNILIQEYHKKYDALESGEKEQALRESEIVQTFKDMARPKLHPVLPCENDWGKLTIILQQCAPLFYQKVIREHHLSGQELQTTILTRLHFSPGEIAYLLNTSPQRITNVKKRVNQKLYGAESAATLSKNLEKE